ncbi:MAG: hypothetical protein ABSE59_11325 [Opitutaceae bacterium]|jgi:hypothetical protein
MSDSSEKNSPPARSAAQDRYWSMTCSIGGNSNTYGGYFPADADPVSTVKNALMVSAAANGYIDSNCNTPS